MGDGKTDLPVEDDEIEDLDDWREAIGEFLNQMYGMRLLCEIDAYSGTRFVHIKEAFAGSSSTLTRRKNRALELYLIEKEIRPTEEGYGTHTYYQLTNVGKHIRAELENRQIGRLHQKLKPLEHQMKSHRDSMKEWGSKMPVDPLVVYYGDHDQ